MEDQISRNLPFLIAGIIIFIGFFGTLFFQKTRLPDILFLLIVGVLIGPICKFIHPEQLKNVTPYFGSLALIIILFEGGLHLDFQVLIKYLGGAIGLGLGVFIASVAGVWAVGEYILHLSRMNALMLGCILGGTSSAIVIPLINTMRVGEDTRARLNLESVLSDILVVLGVIVLIEIIGMGEIRPTEILNTIAGSFSIALIAGGIVGLLWTRALESVKVSPLSYMTTLGLVLVLYATVEMSKASGAIAVFTFGLILRNGTRFLRVFDEKKVFTLDPKIQQFHGEFTFFIRTYFFVYLGLFFTQELFQKDLLINTVLICATFILARYLFVWLLSGIYKPIRAGRLHYFVMLPRGLAAAVVASLPAMYNIPGTENFVAYTTLAILISTVFMVFGIFVVERGKPPGPTPPAEEPVVLDPISDQGAPPEANQTGAKTSG